MRRNAPVKTRSFTTQRSNSNERLAPRPPRSAEGSLPHGVKSENDKKHGLRQTKQKTMFLVLAVGIILVLGVTLTRNNNTTVSSPGVQNSDADTVSSGNKVRREVDEEKLEKEHEEYKKHMENPVKQQNLAPLVEKTRKTKDGRTIPNYHVDDLKQAFGEEEASFQSKPLARGIAGRPMDQTPALVGGKRAHIKCDISVDSLAYWNDPTGKRDVDFVSPFHVQNFQKEGDDKEYFISFAPDRGGWNNVRMSMEIIFVIAAATGRTLVLPPKEPLYLMHHDAENRHRGFADFFPLDTPNFQSRVKVISFAEFLEKVQDKYPELAPGNATVLEKVTAASDHCDKREKSIASCKPVFDYLKQVGTSTNASAVHSCIVFDENYYKSGSKDSIPAETQENIDQVCGPKRDQLFFTEDFQKESHLIHFRASDKEFRLLSHFYNMIHFSNPAIDNYYKRFVRDFLHYHDEIWCAAGKIVQAVQLEAMESRDMKRNPEDGSGGFSALHVRRGDLQYKKVKIPAKQWYKNTAEIWKEKEILYVATDERDKSFFDDLREHYDLRYLDDYWDLADLASLDPNYMGMIDTIVAARGRAFAGTFFSTFTGYINRLRGYYGLSMKDSWYSWLPRKNHTHTWETVDDFAYAYEWPDGWMGIDADVIPSRDIF